jgi:hypothetical protein
MTRLSRKDWDALDDILGRHGFGGYYGLVETLKQVVGDLGITSSGIELYPEHDGGKSISLPQMVQFLQDWARLISNTVGFKEVALICAQGTEVHRVGEGIK